MGFDEDFSRNFDVGEDAKEEDEIESLPEPDEEGRKMAESQEVSIRAPFALSSLFLHVSNSRTCPDPTCYASVDFVSLIIPPPVHSSVAVASSQRACLMVRIVVAHHVKDFPKSRFYVRLLLPRSMRQVKTLSEVLSRSCHFLATPSLQIQALALACMRDCVRKLASAGADAGEKGLRGGASLFRGQRSAQGGRRTIDVLDSGVGYWVRTFPRVVYGSVSLSAVPFCFFTMPPLLVQKAASCHAQGKRFFSSIFLSSW